MKKLFAVIVYLTCCCSAHAQQLARSSNFNNNWEMFRIDSLAKFKSTLVIRNSTSFSSQFNQETIKKKDIHADSIILNELKEATNGFETEYPKIRSLKWDRISLPHPVRYEEELNPGVNQFTGICYYRKAFIIPAQYKGRHLSLRFEGAMQTASVWINGRFVSQHQGGYLPFTIPLNDYVNYNDKNEIIVRLDNRDNINLPPGKPLAKLGFLYWSGIYRDVYLIATDPLYITDPIDAHTIAGGGVFARSENISSKSADVIIKTQVKNSASNKTSSIVIKQTLFNSRSKSQLYSNTSEFEMTGNSVKELEQKITVPTPDLWSPDQPNLYVLKTEIWSNGNLVDNFSQKIGIRKLFYSRSEGFKLNDKPLRIVGTNRHQDYPFIGNALSDAAQYRDLKRIKEAGINFIRLSHYPQDPSVYNVCDSLGIMLGNPIPGWQFFNNNDIFKDRVFSDIREMIRRDRNHPSVIMWEVSLNETYPSDSFRIKSSEIAHEEYPGDNFFTCGDTYAAKHTQWDVPFNNWIDPFGRPQDVQPESPGFVREYGDYEFGGSSSTTRVNRSNGEKALLQSAWNFQWEHNLLRSSAYYPWTIGDATWAFFDGFESFSKTTSDWGMMDVYRLPKFSYYFFKSQLDPGEAAFGAENKPMIYIANWWTPVSKPENVIVYANCDEVALYVNGKLIKKQHPDSGPDTDYGDFEKGGRPFDGGNCTNLTHPPFTFKNINWESGDVKAIGFIKGKKVTEQIVKTPLVKTQLKLIADTQGEQLHADGADAIFVHAQVTDKNGTIMCLDNETKVHFVISGNGKIIGPDTVTVRGGIASILVRGTNNAGLITINATSEKLKEAALKILSK
ncbi:glycoside hydrolase family 2 protein [Mucilaginibacter sp. OK098]|uniref:glycoside hydrolase family 2 protein n=1 Tax=Mucilaginibacter sp. OK098 TaxID=1855297 RepID=UPI0009134F67|nr:glycoside hydrolase family 2 TIM barrel-domain containing protein [Mucilaginibacter sp. OK098]SHM59552.1 beta-galactosidase [Mucilaginibacter sp. OK098]